MSASAHFASASAGIVCGMEAQRRARRWAEPLGEECRVAAFDQNFGWHALVIIGCRRIAPAAKIAAGKRSREKRQCDGPLIALVLAGALAPAAAPAQQAEDIIFAYPNIALTFSAAYLGEDRGFFAKNGLKVKGLVIAGPGATNAVISGSADFALASTVVQTRAAAKGQRLLSIANPLDRPVVQIILRKDLVPNFDPKAPLNDRIRALKGRTIAVDAIGSILHGFPLLLAKRAGLDTATDFRISPMAPPAALAAFKTKQIDGFAMSMPWPIGPVLDGEAVVDRERRRRRSARHGAVRHGEPDHASRRPARSAGASARRWAARSPRRRISCATIRPRRWRC